MAGVDGRWQDDAPGAAGFRGADGLAGVAGADGAFEDEADVQDDEVIFVSKSELKRDAQVLRKLGEKIVALSANQRARLPMDEDLRGAVELAGRLKREGRRRQLQLVGKLLRQRDVVPLQQALERLENRHNQQVYALHKLEGLRDQLLTQGDRAIGAVLAVYPAADRQQLRALVRNARKEQEGGQPPKSARMLFRYLRELAGE